MFGSDAEASRRLGSRRLGGPIEFKDLWPALREELHEVYVAGASRRTEAGSSGKGAA